mgnify:FL=1
MVKLEDPNTLRNLSEPEVTNTIINSFKKAINELTVSESGNAEIRDRIKLREMRPFVVKDQTNLPSKKSVFNKTVGDSNLELRFAQFLERCDDVISYGKNYFQINFKLDYVNATGEISNYYPDFFVKTSPKTVFIIETKGLEDLDDPLKIKRLRQWCVDVNSSQSDVKYDFVYVDQEKFDSMTGETGKSVQQLTDFVSLVNNFREYKVD